MEAIKHGADAVYIGASAFGARAQAGNSIDSIKQLVSFAHQFDARIYCTVNTIVYDNELSDVERMIHHFQNHYMEEIDLGRYAEELGFSAAYLTKIFKRYAGMTPVRFLTTVRISNAKRLLDTTDLSVQQIGESVGYNDQFHFSKTFSKTTGISPMAYRNRHKSSN